MGDNRDTEFASQQQDGETFVYAADSAGVGLEDGECAGLQELFEHDSVLTHFAGCDADGAVGCVGEGFADGGVAEDVVGGGGFFDEPGLELGEFLHVLDGFGDGPNLDNVRPPIYTPYIHT